MYKTSNETTIEQTYSDDIVYSVLDVLHPQLRMRALVSLTLPVRTAGLTP